jgi:periplasmic divalent cation tolerance protein
MLVVYVTCKEKEEAHLIGKKLLQKKLCYCINIVPSILSMYRWEGEIKQSQETLLLVKIDDSHYEKVEQEIKKMHSYDLPAIFTLSVPYVEPAYHQWLQQGEYHD